MVEEKDGWYVVNVKDARWIGHPQFGQVCLFEKEEAFPEIGINLRVLQPGQPNCRYHRESAQENFLVLSGECKMLVNGQEKPLKMWDFVHCPPGTTHVFVGTGDGPCAILSIGKRPVDQIFYPQSEMAAKHGAQAPEPTDKIEVAYSDLTEPRKPVENPAWPL